ncbi:MAG: hypothetical protein LBO78_01995 [Rickettsiales bacterium]|jgi:homoserine kinase|nr:hypothetical protein [Rickettsiales bacterium]
MADPVSWVTIIGAAASSYAVYDAKKKGDEAAQVAKKERDRIEESNRKAYDREVARETNLLMNARENLAPLSGAGSTMTGAGVPRNPLIPKGDILG